MPQVDSSWGTIKIMSIETKLLCGSDYFDAVFDMIRVSRERIFIIMYEYFYTPKLSRSPVNRLTYELVRAKHRGVDIRIILNQRFRIAALREKSRYTYQYFKRNYIPVKMGRGGVTVHAKVLMVDGDLTVIGSTNWSVYAMSRNVEISVAVRSQKLNEKMTSEFLKIWDHLE